MSSTTSKTVTRPLTVKYLFALGLLGWLAVANYLIFWVQIRASQSVVAVVNTSVLQRTLLQRTVVLAQELVTTDSGSERVGLRNELLAVIEPMEAAHHRLIRKDSVSASDLPEKVKSIYFDSPWLLDTEMRNYVAQIRALAKAPDDELHLQNPHFRYIRDAALSGKIVDALDGVVDAYQSQSDSKTGQLRRLAGWSAGSTLVVLVLTGWLVFRPMVRRVRRDVDELKLLNETLEQRVAERTAVAEQRARELAISESALRDQSRILQSILDSMGDGVIVADNEKTYLLFNPAARSMFNIGPDDAPPAGCEQWMERQGVQTPCPPDQLPLLRAMRGEPVDRVEMLLRRSAPSDDLWLSVTATPLRDDRGALQGGVAVLRDITQRKRAEQLLEDSEALHRSLVDNLPLYVLRKDLEGRFTFVNELFCKLLGRPPEEILGKTDQDFYPRELAKKYRADDQRVVETGTVFEVVEEHRTPDGAIRYVEVLKAPLRDSSGGIIGTQTAFWDVTDRKRAEEELREMNIVLENAVEGICRIGAQGRYLAVNKAYASMLGRQPGQLASSLWLESIEPDDQDLAARAFRKMQCEGKVEVEAKAVRADGGCFHAELLMLRSQDKQGDFSGFFLFAKDISERKQAEERILQSERLAAIGQMVAGVAHESRNALQQIQACSRLLEWEIEGNGEARELITDLQKAQDRLHRLFEDLRGYASPMQLDLRRCNLREVFWEAWTALAHQRNGRRITLSEQHTHGVELRCRADPFQLEQVFRNILENSLAACNGQVVIEVAYSAALLEGRAALTVAVRDNGPGLTPDQEQKIFEAFYTTKTQGTGLGMAIAKRIVQAHGGRIEVGHGARQGAEILVTLPRGEP